MKAVILAGGFGTRISELTEVMPKPMVNIGGKPIQKDTVYGDGELLEQVEAEGLQKLIKVPDGDSAIAQARKDAAATFIGNADVKRAIAEDDSSC